MDIQSLALMHTLFTNLRYLKVPYWLLTQQCRNRAGNHVTIIQVKNARIKLPKLQKNTFLKHYGKIVTHGHFMKIGENTQVLVLHTVQMETFTKNACSLNSQQLK